MLDEVTSNEGRETSSAIIDASKGIILLISQPLRKDINTKSNTIPYIIVIFYV